MAAPSLGAPRGDPASRRRPLPLTSVDAAAHELEHRQHAVVELRPGAPSELNRRPLDIELERSSSPVLSGARTDWTSLPDWDAMAVTSSLTDVSRPVPMLQTRPPPRVAARTKASTTSSTTT